MNIFKALSDPVDYGSAYVSSAWILWILIPAAVLAVLLLIRAGHAVQSFFQFLSTTPGKLFLIVVVGGLGYLYYLGHRSPY